MNQVVYHFETKEACCMLFASVKAPSLPGTLMGVTQLPITKETDDGYQKLYSVF